MYNSLRNGSPTSFPKWHILKTHTSIYHEYNHFLFRTDARRRPRVSTYNLLPVNLYRTSALVKNHKQISSHQTAPTETNSLVERLISLVQRLLISSTDQETSKQDIETQRWEWLCHWCVFRHHGVFAAKNFRNSRRKFLVDPLHSHHKKEGAARRQAFSGTAFTTDGVMVTMNILYTVRMIIYPEFLDACRCF